MKISEAASKIDQLTRYCNDLQRRVGNLELTVVALSPQAFPFGDPRILQADTKSKAKAKEE